MTTAQRNYHLDNIADSWVLRSLVHDCTVHCNILPDPCTAARTLQGKDRREQTEPVDSSGMGVFFNKIVFTSA